MTHLNQLEIFEVTDSVTRPSDTTTYGAGEVFADDASAATTAGRFDFVVASPGKSFTIWDAQLIHSASETLKLSSELWLFDTAIVQDNDNAAFTPTDAEMLTLVGVIPFSIPFVGTAGGNCTFDADMSRPIRRRVTAAETKIYGYLVVRNAYAPIASETVKIRLWITRNT